MTSGPPDHYTKDNMYSTVIDDESVHQADELPPAACSSYASQPRSYRDLPINASGNRHGAPYGCARLRGLFACALLRKGRCAPVHAPDQLTDEIVGVIAPYIDSVYQQVRL